MEKGTDGGGREPEKGFAAWRGTSWDCEEDREELQLMMMKKKKRRISDGGGGIET